MPRIQAWLHKLYKSQARSTLRCQSARAKNNAKLDGCEAVQNSGQSIPAEVEQGPDWWWAQADRASWCTFANRQPAWQSPANCLLNA